jgi:DNA-directed RNA polymerase specialized sigma24 family protein
LKVSFLLPHQTSQVVDSSSTQLLQPHRLAKRKLAARKHARSGALKLRYFAGLSVEEAGNALELSRANAYRHWKFARAWLQCELSDELPPEERSPE